MTNATQKLTNTKPTGINIFGWLQLLFIALKLINVGGDTPISGVFYWSWWWVLSPAWIIGVLVLLGVLLGALGKKLERRNARKQAQAKIDAILGGE